MLHGCCMRACSVGAHVRDAAAYVCWAFARAYAADDMAAAAQQLAPALLAAACYDREVCPLSTLVLSAEITHR